MTPRRFLAFLLILAAAVYVSAAYGMARATPERDW